MKRNRQIQDIGPYEMVAAMCVLLLMAGGIYLLVMLGTSRTQALSQEQIALATELTLLTNAAGTVIEAEQLLQALPENTQMRGAGTLPDRPDFGVFYSQLLAWASESQTDITRVQPEAPKTVGAFAAIPVTVECVAAFPALYQFLARVTRDTLSVRLVGLEITAGTPAGTCKAVLTIHILGHPPEGMS